MITGTIPTLCHLSESNNLTSLPFVTDLKENGKVRRCSWAFHHSNRPFKS
ncbi:hypothetical protein [Thermithiobacillus plumbiphilus]|uniref:Uncharacterized protein n=1 Tax=Thermithiobacillus plumbiphilus TaxID=1729899 RepID=A0ABU9DA95_9PROT